MDETKNQKEEILINKFRKTSCTWRHGGRQAQCVRAPHFGKIWNPKSEKTWNGRQTWSCNFMKVPSDSDDFEAWNLSQPHFCHTGREPRSFDLRKAPVFCPSCRWVFEEVFQAFICDSWFVFLVFKFLRISFSWKYPHNSQTGFWETTRQASSTSGSLSDRFSP